MAYISKEQSAAFRKALKAAFPGWKFSVRIEHHSALDVSIMEALLDLLAYQEPSEYMDGPSFEARRYTQVNHYHIDRHWKPPVAQFLMQITKICNAGNHNNSDPMTDYFDVGWYFNLSIGKWDKPFVVTGSKQMAA